MACKEGQFDAVQLMVNSQRKNFKYQFECSICQWNDSLWYVRLLGTLESRVYILKSLVNIFWDTFSLNGWPDKTILLAFSALLYIENPLWKVSWKLVFFLEYDEKVSTLRASLFFSNKRDKHSIILSRFVWPWAWGSRGELKVEKKSWKRKQLSELLIFSSIQFLLLLPKEKEFSVCHKSSQLTCVLPRGLIVDQMSCRFCFILAQKVAKLESSTLFFKWYQTRWNIISSPFATKKYLFISYTSFEYHPKCRIWSFEFWHFPNFSFKTWPV